MRLKLWSLATPAQPAASSATGAKDMDCALRSFPFGDAGMERAHAADPSIMIPTLLRREGKG